MSIAANIRQVNGITIFDLSGRMTAGAEGASLREMVIRAYERSNRWMLLNCENLTLVDSSGLGDLVAAHATMVRRGGVLRLLNPNQQLSNLLIMTGLDSLFEMHDDELIALASFNNAGNARTQQKLRDYLDRDV